MHQYEARVSWARGDARFTDNRYSRGHQWTFDGGVNVPAAASPLAVPESLTRLDAVDPEEALVASAASCHMLFFLSLAARKGFVVDSYSDDAVGIMEMNGEGKLAFSRITLRPEITFSGERIPSYEDLRDLHDRAHDECFIANSLRCEVVVL